MRTVRTIAAIATATLVLAACSGEPTEEVEPVDPGEAADGEVEEEVVTVGEGAVTIEYWLWDSAQLPPYEACAEAFTSQQDEVSVEIRQLGWDDYWNAMVTGFVSGDAPDVFTNHLSRYPEFAANEQLLPIDEFVERDGVDLDQYFEGLADLWVDLEGDRYGLPKDWDTIALFYNADMLADSDLTPEELWELEWNPDDGGSYEAAIAHLTIDANGVRGDEDGFDPDNVEVFGLGLPGAGAPFGQTEWGHYAVSNGWEYMNQETWGDHYNYDDPAFIETMEWFTGLIEKGFMPTLEEVDGGIGSTESFAAGRYAMLADGSWMTQLHFDAEDFEVDVAPVPVGPVGERASMFNGLADSIYVGTDHPEEAWEWVSFLASSDCQDLVGEAAVVFPAIPSSLDIAEQRYAEDGINIEAFTIHLDDETTFLFPISDNASDVVATMEPVFDAVFSFQDEPSSAFPQANDQINAFFD
jgi:multiple sugar transport system substrate-binding protein